MKNLNPITLPKTETKTGLTESTGSQPGAPAPASPVIALPAENPVAPVNPVSTPTSVAVKTALKQARQLEEQFQAGVTQSRDSLGFALRVMIGNDVSGTDAGRLLVENAFEAVKQAAAGGKATRADLVAAAAGLQHAENALANRSLKFPADLATVRDSARKAASLLETSLE